ncbi:DNA polymerase III subunit alpha [Undibacterium sp. RTI2.1]|uniref:DNA polymerase III subunit alpha n=1 Tax=unclassified Undibacterium TaxID=2630295 RepID=UPI002AB3991B|nr:MULTISPECIES: DNA polymerase III subunit alpha [unclassified Undibacterium]MDY7537527.1 DNA polymerase III subunit alpha [Undibacterium sp. 5I1]MEB0029125.1 DNA polymerase III subunit alpha [Undibacterium sp. RTI2.1]MEB0115433.1 DNA polymerase III subunit alpha [Undibacterium sp. RTI2.2]MEB0232892.1 DNA polymerase III subunit alpha [Undibacterium sp. 10I3]MEB0256262.1 DNA polymerase III subunit alpha [Undibacterium sp. 5I1]
MDISHALSVRSDFSIGKSLLQVDHIVDSAKLHGYESVAICDNMSLHSMVDFANRANKAAIKPIIGCVLRVVNDPTYRKPAKSTGIKELPNRMVTIKAYAKNEKGISSLMKLLSKANSKEYFYYYSRVGWDDVLDLEGVAITTGDFENLWHHENAHDILAKLITRFGRNDVFVELVPINTPLFDTLNEKALRSAITHKAQTLATYPFLYRDDADASTLDVLNVITTQEKMSTTYRPKQFIKDFGFRPPLAIAKRVSEMAKRIVTHYKFAPTEIAPLVRESVTNIGVFAENCNYSFKKQPVSLPLMAANEFEALGKKCIEGWKRRFSRPVMGYLPDASILPVYKERLSYELSVLKKMGFAGYFLLVEDLVMWAKSNDIIVGPGRGSVGGSLVAYLIGITDVDPIRFNLLFERFINPERQDLPDADLDFMSTRRHEVITYLATKYGTDRVAGISNFSTLASASALRDAGRVHDISALDLSATKLVPKEHGISFTLTEAAKVVPELERFRDTHTNIWNHALKLEGVMRSFGKHAAGVVVAGEPLINRAVVETRESDDGVPVVNWDKRVVEDWGLVKMDILGLSTLDVLEIARRYIKDRHGVNVVYSELPLEEKDIMDSFGRGDTTGVFQFESGGMKKLLRDLATGGRLTFEDITAATALYRPGPMDSGLMEDFIQIKQGNRDPYYDHPNMEAALKDTYSVIVYQEQVMQVAVDLAGFTKAEADNLRKAMGKKDKDKMAAMRDQWIVGCKSKSGLNEVESSNLFDKIEAFAGYGFNRSHAVEYSCISYWTMWVRVRYPAEYFAACLSIVADDKLTGLVNDAREYGIEILPPDVNKSTDRFTIPDDKHLLAPFSSVKGVSENTAKAIMKLRHDAREVSLDAKGKKVFGARLGRFESFEHFSTLAATKGSKVNVAVVASLEKVGAFAAIEKGLPARHPDRRRDQTELMPGLIIDAVKADRTTDVTDKFVRAKIIHLVQDYRSCNGCDLADQPHPAIRLKSNVKFMVVSDCPSWQEEKADKLLEGESAEFVKAAIKAAGLSPGDGYFTTLVKAKKSEKFLTNAQLNGCSQFFDRELELIKPAVIVALGSAAIKRLVPGIKGSTAELAGKVIYDSKLNASIVCGINAQQIIFDETKLDILQAVFEKVADIIS